MKIIRFSNGNYGIRKKQSLICVLIGVERRYLDLKIPIIWWTKNDKFFSACQSDDLEFVKKIFENVKTKLCKYKN